MAQCDMKILDEKILSAAQVAQVAETDITTVQTWTTRGLTEPYGLPGRLKRGRGRARMYSLRDALKFSLMVRLHKSYRTPLPHGIAICRAVFSDSFVPENARYSIVTATPESARATWFPNAESVAKHLKNSRMATVVNVALVFGDTSAAVSKILRGEKKSSSQMQVIETEKRMGPSRDSAGETS
jgi:hypothetical protein